MHSDRILGICVTLFGVVLLLILIPEHVAEGRGYTDPTRFPKMAAWLFIVLGILHTILSSPGINLPSGREALRVFAVLALALGGAILMHWIGYFAGSILVMAGLTLMVFERRLHWIVLTTIVVPFGLYAFFVLLLDRPLPRVNLF